MKKYNKWIICLTVLLVSLIFTGSVYASEGFSPKLDDKVVFFGTYTLESGETLEGSLIVFGGVVNVEEDATVNGDLVVFAGNVTVDGTVTGSLLVVGGVVDLNETAIIQDDLIAPGTVVRKDDGAQISGQIITETDIENLPDFPEIETPEIVTPAPPTFWENVSYALQPVVEFFANIVSALLFAAVALVVLLLLPAQGERVSNAIQNHTVLAGAFGMLSVMVFVFAVVLLAFLSVTIILIPVTVPAILLLSLALSLGIFFGVIVVGAEFGRRLMNALKMTWNRNVQVAVGTFSLVFLLGVFNMALWDFLVVLVWILVGAIGLGAVLLTRFGSREYIGAAVVDQAERSVEDIPVDDDDFDQDLIETMVRKRPDRFKLEEPEDIPFGDEEIPPEVDGSES